MWPVRDYAPTLEGAYSKKGLICHVQYEILSKQNQATQFINLCFILLNGTSFMINMLFQNISRQQPFARRGLICGVVYSEGGAYIPVDAGSVLSKYRRLAEPH